MQLHAANPEISRVVLTGDIITTGEFYEQIASKQEIVGSAIILDVLTELYLNRATGKLKVGSASKGFGSVRRFITVFNQLRMTWDLQSQTTSEILSLLPIEFEHVRQRA